MSKWSKWQIMPCPEDCRSIQGPDGPGVYQIRNRVTGELIQFGIGIECRKRMKSLFPKPFGSGTRNNEAKRNYVLKNWQKLEYRTMATESKELAKVIEDGLKAMNNHLFNT